MAPSCSSVTHAASGLAGGTFLVRMAALVRKSMTISCCASPDAGPRGDPAFRCGARRAAVHGWTGLRHHHPQRGHGAAADERHGLPVVIRRPGAVSALGSLVTVQPQRRAPQPAAARKRNGTVGFGRTDFPRDSIRPAGIDGGVVQGVQYRGTWVQGYDGDTAPGQ